ncbi:MAG: lamin tail domain-containing protein, partial [Pirellulales bacterium]
MSARRASPVRRAKLRLEPLEPRALLTGAAVVISELLAVNDGGLVDADGDSSDWIELFNSGDEPADLGGWHLSDEPQSAAKWTFPQGTQLAGGQYLVVFASAKNRAVAGSPLHTNFALDGDGESLLLVSDTLSAVHEMTFPAQRADVSYGLVHNGTGVDLEQSRFFTSPTPGSANTAGVIGFVDDVFLDHGRGFYQPSDAFSLGMQSATAGATIYYTTNGSVPGPANAAAQVYNPAAPPLVDRTTVVRAVAHKTDFAPARVATASFVFVSDVVSQSPLGQAPPGWPTGPVNGQVLNYGMDPDIVNSPVWGPQLQAALTAIPSYSIVTDLANLFDPATGIYTHASPHGEVWERPTSVELIYPDGSDPENNGGFQIDAGLRIRGGFSRSSGNPKHAFRLFFREEYGAAKLNYPLFGDEGVDEFDKLDLRADQNDSWAFQASRELTMIHDVFARDTQRDMGQPYTRSRPAHLYINGVYWGVFQTQERPEADFGASYFGGVADEYDVIKSTGPVPPQYSTEATDGDLLAWEQLWQGARSAAADPNAYLRLQGLNPDGTRNLSYPVLLDVDNLIDYMTIIFWTGDEDAPLSQPFGNNRSNNWFGMRRRTGDEGFRFFIHDAEQTMFSNHNFGDLSADRVGPFVFPANQNNLLYSNPQW